VQNGVEMLNVVFYIRVLYLPVKKLYNHWNNTCMQYLNRVLKIKQIIIIFVVMLLFLHK